MTFCKGAIGVILTVCRLPAITLSDSATGHKRDFVRALEHDRLPFNSTMNLNDISGQV